MMIKRQELAEKIENLKDKAMKAAQVSKVVLHKNALQRKGHDFSRHKDRHQSSRR